MTKFSKIISAITLVILTLNILGPPVLAIKEVQKKPSNSEELITDSDSDIELPTVDSLLETTEREFSDERIECQASEMETESVTESKVTTENNEDKDLPKNEKESKNERSAKELDVSVNDWGAFVNYLADSSVTKITVNSDLTATSVATVNHDVQVDAGDHTITFNKGQSINVVAGTLTMQDLVIKGTDYQTSAFIGEGDLTFQGNVSVPEDNGTTAIKMPNSTVTFDEVKGSFHFGTNRELPVIVSKSLITKGGVIDVTSPQFLKTTVSDATFESSGTKWNIKLAGTYSDRKVGALFEFSNTSDVLIDENTEMAVDFSVQTRGAGYRIFAMNGKTNLAMNGLIVGDAGRAALFDLKGSDSVLTMTGKKARIQLDNAKSSLLRVIGLNVRYRLDQGATVNYTQAGEASAAWESAIMVGAAIGNQTNFEMVLAGNSKMKINKTAKGDAVAVFMFGNKNNITVKGASDFIVYNKGSGTNATQTSERNHGVMYKGNSGMSGGFTLEDENSLVDITADLGAAITTYYVRNTVTAGEGTYFIARGKPNKAGGVIRSRVITFDMDNMKYYDFQHGNGGKAINTSEAGASFVTRKTNMSVWLNGTNINGQPHSQWEDLEYSATGVALNKNIETNNADFKALIDKVGGLTSFSRITANNQTAVVEKLRVPTDADNKVFAMTEIPEGKYDPKRPAYENEVTLTMQEVTPNGEVVQEGVGKTLAENTTLYLEDGDKKFTGVTQIHFDNYIQKGNTIKVSSGYIGSTEEGFHKIPEKDIGATEVVRDITPPTSETIVNNINKISTGSKSIKGKTSEPGYVTVYTTNKGKQSTTVATDDKGNYEVPMIPGLNEGDSVFVAGKDRDSKQTDVLNPPITNDEQGNEQPISEFKYHDREFKTATEVILVGGEVTLESAPTSLDFGENKIARSDLNLKPTYDKALIVMDTRVDGLREEWSLTLKVTQPFVNKKGDFDLTPGLSYTNRSKYKQDLSASDIIVEQTTHERDGALNLSENWQTDEGFNLNVPSEKQKADEFTGELGWTLQKSVANKEE